MEENATGFIMFTPAINGMTANVDIAHDIPMQTAA